MEVNARPQLQALQLSGTINYLEPEEGRLATQNIMATVGWPWELWKRKALKM